MTDKLYEQMKFDYENACQNNVDKSALPHWNNKIEQSFKPIMDTLFTYDFPTTSTPDFNNADCFEFLELNHIPTKNELKMFLNGAKHFYFC